MSPLFFQLSEYLKYRLKAVNAHGLHSPFLFSLYNEVIKDKDKLEEKRLLTVRKKFLNLDGELTFKDPKTGNSKKVNLKNFANSSSTTHRFSYFLYKLIKHQDYQSILETGTCVGTNAAYLSQTSANEIWSIEGSKELAKIATNNLYLHEISNVNIVAGKVQEVFIKTLESAQPDLIFLDADHRQQTIQFYLDSIKKHSPSTKCIIIHDIHWSKDMLYAWEKAISNSAYTLTIDLFQAGIIFPKYPIEKQHFIVKF